jgi:hypothetical protein
MLSAYVLPLLLAGLAWSPALAAPLYKWVDSAGQVIYSSSPPPAGTQVEKVQAPPQPSAEEVRQTEERAKRIEEQANELEAQRRQKPKRPRKRGCAPCSRRRRRSWSNSRSTCPSRSMTRRS